VAPPPDEAEAEKTSSIPTLLVAIVIVVAFGFAGWRWFSGPAAIAPVYAASKAVERNLSLKRTIPQLSGSVQRFSTAIAAVRETDISEDETEALDYYEQAVDVLNDSLKLWAAKEAHGPALSPDTEGVAPLKEKYFLPTDDAGNIESDESLEIIWLKAQESLDAGNQFYVPVEEKAEPPKTP
jgi:hypothetical protein